uniref:Uncharacterized protein n=1 Tax=Rhizophora mucronata TaxID=61149 RepID=A0A2P2NSS2_RHIMU
MFLLILSLWVLGCRDTVLADAGKLR